MKKIALLLLTLTLTLGSVHSEEWGKEITESLSEVTKSSQNELDVAVIVEQCEVSEETLLDLKATAAIKGKLLNAIANFEYHHKDLSPVKPDFYFDMTVLPATIDLESIGGMTEEILFEYFKAFTAEQNPEAFKFSISKWKTEQGYLVSAEATLMIDCSKLEDEEASLSDVVITIKVDDGCIFASLSGNIIDDESAKDMNELLESLELIKNRDPEFMSSLQELFDNISEQFLETEAEYTEDQTLIQL